MKKRTTKCIALATILAASSQFAAAQTEDLTIQTFDTGTQGESAGTPYQYWYGSETPGWDGNEDATGNGGGSLYIQSVWGGSDTPLIQMICTEGNNLWWSGSGTYNLSDYKSIQFDIKWDPSSTITIDQWNNPTNFPNGSLAGSSPGLDILGASGAGGTPDILRTNIPALAASGWAHMTIPVNPALPGIDPAVGIMLKKYLANNSSIVGTNELGEYTNTANFWIDNVMLEGTAEPPPPPTLTLEKNADPGLNLFTSAQYARESIRTVDSGYGFYNAATPTTYSYNVSKYPGAANFGFQTHVFLVPNAPAATTSGPDWNSPNVIWLNLQNGADGTNTLSFQYKTNLPNGNSMYFNSEPTNGPVGTLGTVTSTSIKGTWGMTFNNNTNVTIFSPTSSTNIILPPDSAALFDAPINAYFGSQPNQTANQGLASVLSQAAISGAVSSPDLTDNFPGSTLNTNNWELSAADPDNIVVVPSDAAYWLNWTLPDAGFSPQLSADVSSGYTNAPGDVLTLYGKRGLLVTEPELPGAEQGYWRLIKRTFSKLQILLPGETAAPGTPSGKTGTPDPQNTVDTFFVTVRAVDAEWYPVSGVNDIVHYTSTDGSAFLEPDGSLVNGEGTGEMLMGTGGPQTITVEDLTDPSKTSDTSSSFMVN